MPRCLRIEYEGAIYHVMNRGDRREAIVQGDEDRRLFVETMGEACLKCGWEIHAWCLMSNHFHLVVETPHGNLVTGMKWFLGTYTMRYNARHRQRGHLFSGRYKALLVDDKNYHYLRTVCDYVHLNPDRAGLITPEERLETCPWSSYGVYLMTPQKRPAWLRVDRVLGEHGIQKENRAGRLEFARRMESQRVGAEAEGGSNEGMLQGWRMGSEEFVMRMLDQLEEKTTAQHTAAPRKELMTQRAERIIAEELMKMGCSEADLPSQRKGDPRKIALAKHLRRETTMSLAWIARRLHMGQWTYLSNLLKDYQ